MNVHLYSFGYINERSFIFAAIAHTTPSPPRAPSWGKHRAPRVGPGPLRAPPGSLLGRAEERRQEIGLRAERRIVLHARELAERSRLERDDRAQAPELVDPRAEERPVEAPDHRERRRVRDDVAMAGRRDRVDVVRISPVERRGRRELLARLRI